MASVGAVWGIDIGQCALKAMRCRLADDGETIIADAFDYIEYPKILTEPDANPEQLVRDAMKAFLANNSVRDAKVAISVPGQSGLTRFIKLPPVEAKKIPDIVKYEAKQQIPFSLDDVIWDYQPLLGGVQDEGVALETEVGLFAMKREQVFRALRPFRDAGIELDIVQLTPIAIYNAVGYGVLENVPRPEDYDPDHPPKSVAVISMGTDTTDLVVTNGFRIWQRSIPIGGSHFTKQLMKEMKLTFAKAEHLKRNARQADDPKAVFQAMRPVFNDFVQELQRSLGFFRSIDRRAQITQAVALGNAMLLPGLQPYVEKNLELPVQRVAEFRHLDGSSVISTPKFKDNILSFAVAYGLCVQGLSRSKLTTNLIPRELVTARLIRRKKPWALLALTVFFIGLCFNYLFLWSRWREAHEKNFTLETGQVTEVQGKSGKLISDDDELKRKYDGLKKLGNDVVGGADARFLMLDLMAAIDAALPAPLSGDPMSVSKDPYGKRTELVIESINSEYFPDLAAYFTAGPQERYKKFLANLEVGKKRQARLAAGEQPDAAATPSAEGAAAEGEASTEAAGDATAATTPPAESAAAEGTAAPAEGAAAVDVTLPDVANKAGWVIEISGFHFHKDDVGMVNIDGQYLVNTVLDKLENGSVELPGGPGAPAVSFTMKELGVLAPIIAKEERSRSVVVPDPTADPNKKTSTPTAPRAESGQANVALTNPVNRPVYEFTIQFMWVPTRASERLEARKEKEQSAASKDELAGG